MRRSENEGGNTKKTFFIMYNFHKMYTHYENWKLDPAMAATKYEKYEKVSNGCYKIALVAVPKISYLQVNALNCF